MFAGNALKASQFAAVLYLRPVSSATDRVPPKTCITFSVVMRYFEAIVLSYTRILYMSNKFLG